jgi:hypothetical protein
MARLRLPPEEFDRIVDKTDITPENRALARRVLVDGERPARLARELPQTRQAIEKVVRRVIDHALNSLDCPEGWNPVLLCMPPDIEAETRERLARRRAGKPE